MEEWQPIETAPLIKSVIVWGHGYLEPLFAFSDGHSWHFPGCDRFILATPSHWMPLPKPPVV